MCVGAVMCDEKAREVDDAMRAGGLVIDLPALPAGRSYEGGRGMVAELFGYRHGLKLCYINFEPGPPDRLDVLANALRNLGAGR